MVQQGTIFPWLLCQFASLHECLYCVHVLRVEIRALYESRGNVFSVLASTFAYLISLLTFSAVFDFCLLSDPNIHIGALKKGSFVVLKGFPCKISDYSTSKTGKHGHAKANIVGIDIFTGRKYEDISPSSHNMEQPVVTRNDYQLIDIDEEGFVTIMDDKTETRSDLQLDLENDEIHKKLKDDFEEGKDLLVTVLAAMSIEKIIASKEIQ